ncbi:hypothetical protein OHA98_33385 [Streptomyces sp. NBC_00654]|uniref:hypothetical protein n=1 Tax=Streptomyces sp. NBC_00654 TaxID=2975799 RepID=UPI0022532F09|nr:hypothetical protein [Streptomyces sp. NBC_00654]MCX4969565.1 hypothetical protein [Streptomyces sp. NBC_00654]
MPPNPPARLRDGRALTTFGLAAGLAVPAALLGGTPAAAHTDRAVRPVAASAPASSAGRQSACGDRTAKDFPIDTRIHGGPDTYASGGGYGTWYLDLTNTTSEPCPAIHPVLVLTDQDRRLTADQIQLKFSERTGPGTEHRVTWETTDRDEQIGVFGGGESDEEFSGFTVPAGRTVTVRVRMAFTSDTRPGRVTANAAVVQRHPGRTTGKATGRAPGTVDGDWVGESDDYPFAIVEGGLDGGRESGGTGTDTGADADPGTSDTVTDPGAPLRDAAGNPLPELARTGQNGTVGAGIAAGALFVGGSAMVVRVRRTRRTHG